MSKYQIARVGDGTEHAVPVEEVAFRAWAAEVWRAVAPWLVLIAITYWGYLFVCWAVSPE